MRIPISHARHIAASVWEKGIKRPSSSRYPPNRQGLTSFPEGCIRLLALSPTSNSDDQFANPVLVCLFI